MRELRAGDNIAYLFDREQVTAAYVQGIRNTALAQMAGEWLQQYSQRFFLTVARNYQPIAGADLNTFASHDDSVLFEDKAALLEYLPRLAQASVGFVWVVLATADVQAAARAAMVPADSSED